MFGSNNRLRQLFANRFETDGDGYLFRTTIGAPGFKVSAQERDRWLATFSRRIQIAIWATGGLTALIFVAAFLIAPNEVHVSDWWVYGMVALCLAPLLFINRWLWNAPVRALHGRTPDAQGRSKAEAGRLAFQRITWAQLGLAAAAPFFLLLRVGSRNNLLLGWNRLWLVAAVLFLAFVAFQAFRKWRAGLSQ
jgi:hypothetical protein